MTNQNNEHLITNKNSTKSNQARDSKLNGNMYLGECVFIQTKQNYRKTKKKTLKKMCDFD